MTATIRVLTPLRWPPLHLSAQGPVRRAVHHDPRTTILSAPPRRVCQDPSRRQQHDLAILRRLGYLPEEARPVRRLGAAGPGPAVLRLLACPMDG